MVNAFSPNKVLAQSFLVDYVGTTEVNAGTLHRKQSTYGLPACVFGHGC